MGKDGLFGEELEEELSGIEDIILMDEDGICGFTGI